MGIRYIFTANFNRRLAFSVTVVAVSAANYGLDNKGFSATQAMDPFGKQFGVSQRSGKYLGQYELQAHRLSLYSSVIWAGFAVGELPLLHQYRFFCTFKR